MNITAICSNWACLRLEINCNHGSYGKRKSKGVRRAEGTFGVFENERTNLQASVPCSCQIQTEEKQGLESPACNELLLISHSLTWAPAVPVCAAGCGNHPHTWHPCWQFQQQDPARSECRPTKEPLESGADFPGTVVTSGCCPLQDGTGNCGQMLPVSLSCCPGNEQG